MFKLFKVKGRSMAPLYFPNDYVICVRCTAPQVKDMVVAESSYGKLLKQIKSVDEKKQTVRLQGISSESLSSADMGDVPFSAVSWKVIFPRRKQTLK